MTDIYAVVGNPISHSKSPRIHHAFAEQTLQDMLYKAQLIELGQFTEKANKFFQYGGVGMNVTVPFKQDAFAFADELSERAKRAGAVNTLMKLPNGRFYGDNTDGAGLVRDLRTNHQVTLQGKRILLLGAGGAVRGVLQPLLDEQPAELIIANRTLSKAEALAEDFAAAGPVRALDFNELKGEFDLVINGTSASLAGELPPVPVRVLRPNTLVYDMMYGKGRTVFNQWAFEHGVHKTLDGLGMLVEQAAEAFYLWRGVRPQTQTLIEQLRREL